MEEIINILLQLKEVLEAQTYQLELVLNYLDALEKSNDDISEAVWK